MKVKKIKQKKFAGGNNMGKLLKNNFDKEISFESLEEAKKYYKPSEEALAEHANMDASEYLGDPDDLGAYIEHFFEYAEEIEKAETLEELADVLNAYTDTFDNGSRYFVIEF